MQHKAQRKSLWSLALWKGCWRTTDTILSLFCSGSVISLLTPDLARELWKDDNNFRVSEVGAGPEAVTPDLQRRWDGGAVLCGEYNSSWLYWPIISIGVCMIHAKNPISCRKWKKKFQPFRKNGHHPVPHKKASGACMPVKMTWKPVVWSPVWFTLAFSACLPETPTHRKWCSQSLNCFRVIASFLFWFLFVLILYFMVLFYFISFWNRVLYSPGWS